MTTAIRIENVSKLYRLGTVGTGTIAHDLNRWWHKIRGKEDPYAKIGQVNDRTKSAASDEKRETSSDSGTSSQLATRNSSLSSPSPLASRLSPLRAVGPDYVWALRDINLDVKQGEILGIIGRNGAGKSTLLKLLSRVTAPTTGMIKTKGRIASLLEVGTGFHPELTGRENIYMNGAILGMRRAEITRQLDEIVDFSGCAKYVDTPVKRYSSGMMVRLGFAVAAHLQCEILIVDEVLAVGDAEFQAKCIGKMRSVSAGGKTVLFVSHNLLAVSSLCNVAARMEHGTISELSTTREQIHAYLQMDRMRRKLQQIGSRTDRQGTQQLRITNITFHNVCHGTHLDYALSGDDIRIRFQYASTLPNTLRRVHIAFNVKDNEGRVLTNLNSDDANLPPVLLGKEGCLDCDWPNFNLREGTYSCNVFCTLDGEICDWIEDAFELKVQDGDFHKNGRLINRSQGAFLITHAWTHCRTGISGTPSSIVVET